LRVNRSVLIALTLLSACARRDNADSRVGAESASLAGAASTSVRCPTADSAVFEGTALAKYDGWYGEQLRALGERGLCSAGDSVAERYRFTWIPSFHPSAVVLLERDGSQARLVAKLLSGAGGYEPGTVVRDTVIALSASEWRMLTRRIRATDLWSVPQLEPPSTAVGLDGSQWILEGVRGGRYNVADRWSPRPDGPYVRHRAVGELLLQQSGLVPSELVADY